MAEGPWVHHTAHVTRVQRSGVPREDGTTPPSPGHVPVTCRLSA